MVVDPDDIEWDDANREHATRHGITVEEITQALLNNRRCVATARAVPATAPSSARPTEAARSPWWSPGIRAHGSSARSRHGSSDE